MGNLDKKYGCESVKNKDEIINSHMKPLQLGKVGKAIQGECKTEKGKIIFINRDRTIKTVWED